MKPYVSWKHCFISLALFSLSMQAVSGDAAKGKEKADKLCAACHGKTGISTTQTIPNLAGQKRIYLESALNAYKDKKRTNGQAYIMMPHAASLSEQEIKNLALYYSEL